MLKWKCKHCGENMMLDFAHDKSTCKACKRTHVRTNVQKEYHRDYMAARRWMDGSNDNFLLGEK
jgi:hypothetical protein